MHLTKPRQGLTPHTLPRHPQEGNSSWSDLNRAVSEDPSKSGLIGAQATQRSRTDLQNMLANINRANAADDHDHHDHYDSGDEFVRDEDILSF